MKPSAILTADWHIREDTPTCRTDDFFAAQIKKIEFILALSEKHNCPILIAGDLFHKAKSSPFLESTLMLLLRAYPSKNFYSKRLLVIPGQHDLPNHNFDLIHKSSFGVMIASQMIDHLDSEKPVKSSKFILTGFSYGSKIKPCREASRRLKNDFRSIALAHFLVTESSPKGKSKVLRDFAGATSAKTVLKNNPDYDLIVTGDNHKSFSESYQDRLLVNPGNITRQAADQIDHKPRVALWYAKTNEIEWVEIPIKKDSVTADHLEEQNERDSRLSSFVEKLNDGYEIGLSFERNLKEYLQSNRTKKRTTEIIWEMVENE